MAELNESQPEPIPSEVSFLQIWYLALVRPSEEAYHAIYRDPGATVARGLMWVGLAGLASSSIALLAQSGQWMRTISRFADQLDVGSLAAGSALVLLCLIPIMTIMTVVGLLVYAAILHFVGSAFGGEGRFPDMLYMLSVITAPVTLLNSLLGAIPIVGACLALPFAAYSIYLNALAVKSIHRFSWVKTIVTLLVPVILSTLLFLIVFAAFLLPVVQEMIQSGAGL